MDATTTTSTVTRVAVGAVRKGDLVSETVDGPFYPVLLSVPGLLRIDARLTGEPLPLDIAAGLSSGVYLKA